MEYSRSLSQIADTSPTSFYAIIEGMSRIAAFDTKNSTARTLNVSVTFPANCAWTLYREKWLIVTGGKRSAQAVNEVLGVEIDSREVKHLPELPEAVYDHCSLEWQDKVFVFGGYDTGLNAVFSFETGVWEVLEIPRLKGHKPYACAFNDRIMIAPHYGSQNFRVFNPTTLELTTLKLKVESPSTLFAISDQLFIVNSKIQTYASDGTLVQGFAAEKGLNLWSAGPVFRANSKLYLLKWLGCRFVEIDLEARKAEAVSIDVRQIEPEPCSICPRKDCITSAECNWSRRRTLLAARISQGA